VQVSTLMKKLGTPNRVRLVLKAHSLASIFRRGASGRCDGLRITVWD
jgi:hypothetical protein